MTITATPTAQTDATQNELELLGVPWTDIADLDAGQLSRLWDTLQQISPEDRPAFAAYMGSDLTAVTDKTVTDFRTHYVGTFSTVHDFLRTYARARWFTPMAATDAHAAATHDLESMLDWIDYQGLSDALFHDKRSPYTFTIGMGADYVFTTKETQPVQPRVSF